ncbi:MAG: preprotein translocase subunit SecE [Acidimicrobiia bacterium]
MNREMRRMQEREERRKKKEKEEGSKAQRKAAQMQSKAPQTERKPFFRRVRDYLHEVRVELRKVTWPTREQMIAFTTVTLITSTALTFVIFGFDFAAKQFILWLIDLTR